MSKVTDEVGVHAVERGFRHGYVLQLLVQVAFGLLEVGRQLNLGGEGGLLLLVLLLFLVRD